ncbi:hypothetical protein MASR2M79_24210 [Aminivibrio sp.]
MDVGKLVRFAISLKERAEDEFRKHNNTFSPFLSKLELAFAREVLPMFDCHLKFVEFFIAPVDLE